MSKSPRRRRVVAQHGELHTPGPVGQLLKLVGIVVTVVLVSGIGVGAYLVSDLSNAVASNSVELEGQQSVPPDISEYEGGFDILLAGLDKCEEAYAHLFGKRCKGRVSDNALNDVNVLVHVSDEPRRITAVSFPRDLLVTIPPCADEAGGTTSAASMVPLNSAYNRGGLNCVVQAITELTGQDIEFAASVTFGGVIEITNAIGGVEVCLASGIKDKYTQLDMPAGIHTIQGFEALQFLRTRHGVGDGSDLGRIGNQQQYMTNLAKKLISGEVLGDVPTLFRLADAALSNLEASTSLSQNPSTLVQIALAVKDVDFSDIVFVQYPNGSDRNYPNKVVPDHDAAAALWDAINANRPLEITHENNRNEGVVVEDSPTPDAEPDDAAPAPPAPESTASASEDAAAGDAAPDEAVALPDSIKGNSAAQKTCSNGNRR